MPGKMGSQNHFSCNPATLELAECPVHLALTSRGVVEAFADAGLGERAGGTEAIYVVADGSEADFEFAGDGVLASALPEHRENFGAQFGGMAREWLEG